MAAKTAKAVMRLSVGKIWEAIPDYPCTSPDAAKGYRFSKAMENPGFIGIDDIQSIYLPMGFSNFKIEGADLAVPCCWNSCYTI